MSSSRRYEKKVEMQRVLDWELLLGLEKFFREKVSEKLSVHIEDSDGNFTTSSVRDARRELQKSGATLGSIFVDCGLSRTDPNASYHGDYSSEIWPKQVSFNGSNQEQVLGLAEVLQQHLDRDTLKASGLKFRSTPKPAGDENERNETKTEKVAEGRLRVLVRRASDHQIVSGLIVAGIVALISVTVSFLLS